MRTWILALPNRAQLLRTTVERVCANLWCTKGQPNVSLGYIFMRNRIAIPHNTQTQERDITSLLQHYDLY